MSDAQKEKLRIANLGKKQSPETIAKRVTAIKGKKQPPEMVAKRVASRAATMAKRQAYKQSSLWDGETAL